MNRASTSTWLADKLIDGLVSFLLGAVFGPLALSLWNLAAGFLGRPELSLPWQAAIVTFFGIVLATLAARRFSGLADFLEMAWLRLAYFVRMLPFWLREMSSKGEPGRGGRNQRYASEAAFYAADKRRETLEQIDHGQHWQDPRLGPCRLTWISTTRELIAVAHNKGGAQGVRERPKAVPLVAEVAEIIVEDVPPVRPGQVTKPRRDGGPVEVLAMIHDESEFERRLADYHYVLRGDLRWARRRAYGLNVPLPPGGEWWKRFDRCPEPTPPPPPPPSLGEPDGAYLGLWEEGGRVQVKVGDEPARELYHFVDSSPTGFAWGYGGSGPWDLARSVLADRLGYIPNGDVVMEFKNGVVAKLAMPAFSMTFADVDAWIDSHTKLFARDPRAGWPRRRAVESDQGFTVVRSARPGEFDQ